MEIPDHVKIINLFLKRLVKKEFNKLIINLPPRHFKTSAMVDFVVDYLKDNENNSILYITYDIQTAEMVSKIIADKSLQKYKTIDSSNMIKFTDSNNILNYCGSGGNYHGCFDLVIIDSPYKNSSFSLNYDYRKSLNDWYNSFVSTRLNKDANVILIDSRWHYDDLTLLLSNLPNSKHIVFPALAEEDEDWVVWGRKKGEALYPQRYSIKELEKIREREGYSGWWESLYQQLKYNVSTPCE